MLYHRRILSREDNQPVEELSEQAKRCIKRVTHAPPPNSDLTIPPLELPLAHASNSPDPAESDFSFEEIFEEKQQDRLSSETSIPPTPERTSDSENQNDSSAIAKLRRTFFTPRSPPISPSGSPLTSPRDSTSPTSPITSPESKILSPRSSANQNKRSVIVSPPQPRVARSNTPRGTLEKSKKGNTSTTSINSLVGSWAFTTPKRTVSSFLSTPYKVCDKHFHFG
jgi:hypothetical protein